jgi:hypothetical protein
MVAVPGEFESQELRGPRSLGASGVLGSQYLGILVALESQEIVHGRNVLEQKCLARSSGWQQAVAGNKQWLAASNGWQQAVDGNTQRTAIGSGWQQEADGHNFAFARELSS